MVDGRTGIMDSVDAHENLRLLNRVKSLVI